MVDWRSLPYIIPLFIGTLVSWGVSAWSWRKRDTSGALAFGVLMLAVGLWAFGYAFEVGVTRWSAKIWWAKIEYPGIVTIPVAWLFFTARYSGQHKWLTRRNAVLLSIWPLLVCLAAWTNEWHGWLWRKINPDTSLGFTITDFDYGPIVWMNAAYIYTALLVGIILLFGMFLRAEPLYRRQVGAMLMGALIPWIGNVVYLLGLSPFPSFDLTPLAFSLTGLVIGLALFRFRLIDIMPIARGIVLDNIDDGVIVVDALGRVVDINPAARQLIDIEGEVVGRQADQVLSPWADLVEQYRDVERVQTELNLIIHGVEQYVNLRILPLYDRRSRLIGRLIVLEDITRRKQIEMALATQNERQSALYRFLIELGAHFDPQQIVRIAVDFALRLGNWTAAAVLLPDAEQTHLVVAAVVGPFSWPENTSLPVGAHNITRAFYAVEVEQWSDVHGYALAVPLEHGGRRLGVLGIENQAPINADDVLLAQSLGEAIALALDNARLYEQVRQNAADLTTLYTVTQLAGQSLTLNAVLKPVVETFGFDAGLISIVEGERLRVGTHIGFSDPALPAPADWDLTGTACDRVHRTQKPLIITGTEAPDEPLDHALVARLNAWGFAAYLGVPICYAQQCLGTVALFAKMPRRFSSREIRLLETLGRQLASAILNVRLYEQAVNERTLLETIIDSNHDGILMIGRDGCVRVINAAAVTMFQLSGRADAWAGRPIQDLLLALRKCAPKAVRAMIAELRRIAAGDDANGEGEYQVPPRIIHWHNFGLAGQNGGGGRLLVLHDVTETRQLERMREDLTHTMVHDLRNPLTGIAVSLNLLAEKAADRLTPAQRRVLELGQSSTQKMLTLVNTILDVSRLENRQMPISRTPTFLHAIASEVIDSQMVLAAEKNLDLQNRLPPDLPLVQVDAGLIERVLINLIGNSVKFTPNGGLIRLSAQVIPAGIQVTVYNNGPHIPTEMMGRLFERFVTGQMAESGSGLGLAFCKLAVEAHGGRIWAENVYPDNGVAFHFTLPTENPQENPKGLQDL